MRLIDAEVLKQKVTLLLMLKLGSTVEFGVKMLETIDDAPTVELKTGKWRKYVNVYECSTCGALNDRKGRYCENCGAKMEVADE